MLEIDAMIVGSRLADSFDRFEQARLRQHFTRVLSELHGADDSRLPSDLRAARHSNVARLRAYVERGAFPRNRDYPGREVPYFIDEAGVTCAVADLLIGSGCVSLASAIAGAENNARVPAMRTPELADWVVGSGLTFAECAAIQPSYCCGRPGGTLAIDDYGDAGAGGSGAGGEGAGGSGAGSSTTSGGGQGGLLTGGHGGVGGAAGSGGDGGDAGAAGASGGTAGGGGEAGSGGQAARAGGREGARLASNVWRPRGSPAIAVLSFGFFALIARRNERMRRP